MLRRYQTRAEKQRKEKTLPFGVNVMRSQLLYQLPRGIKVVSDRLNVPPIASSLQIRG